MNKNETQHPIDDFFNPDNLFNLLGGYAQPQQKQEEPEEETIINL
jgi:hypothetical protein